MNQSRKQNTEGVALLAAIIFVAVAGMILGALAMRVVQQGQQSSQYKIFNDNFPVLDAAVARSMASLDSSGTGNIGLGTWAPVTTDQIMDLPTFHSTGIAPLTMTTMPRIRYMAYADKWLTDGVDNNNNGIRDDATESDMFTIYGIADNRGVERSIEVVLGGSDVNAWRTRYSRARAGGRRSAETSAFTGPFTCLATIP